MKKIHEFKIYPFSKKIKGKKRWDKSCHWTIRFCQSPKDLRTATAKRCNQCKVAYCGGADHLGLAHSHHRMERMDTYGNLKDPNFKGEIGVIFLQKENCGGGIISHECCHAMLYTVMFFTHVINALSPTFSEADEQMAQILGNLCNQIYIEIQDKSLV